MTTTLPTLKPAGRGRTSIVQVRQVQVISLNLTQFCTLQRPILEIAGGRGTGRTTGSARAPASESESARARPQSGSPGTARAQCSHPGRGRTELALATGRPVLRGPPASVKPGPCGSDRRGGLGPGRPLAAARARRRADSEAASVPGHCVTGNFELD